MIKVKVTNEKIDIALKKWKRKVKDTKQLHLQREAQAFTKPSVKRRAEKIKAAYKQRMRDQKSKS
jgi:small subunit ribosomal protein S21